MGIYAESDSDLESMASNEDWSDVDEDTTLNEGMTGAE
jgi:hypothetical protein